MHFHGGLQYPHYWYYLDGLSRGGKARDELQNPLSTKAKQIYSLWRNLPAISSQVESKEESFKGQPSPAYWYDVHWQK